MSEQLKFTMSQKSCHNVTKQMMLLVEQINILLKIFAVHSFFNMLLMKKKLICIGKGTQLVNISF